LTFFECKYQITPTTLLVFVDVGKYSIMVDDVATPLNPRIAPLKKEEFKEALFDMNVSQRLCEKNV
jgi:hypothetical protein